MPGATQFNGLGVVWAVKGITYTATVAGAAGNPGIAAGGTTDSKLQTLRLERAADRADIKNEIGDTVGTIWYNFKKTITLSVVPVATSIAAGTTSHDAHGKLTPGTIVVFADANSQIIDGDFGGAFQVTRNTENRTNTGAPVFDLELEQFDANNVATAVT